jgi:hypothetical protein
MYGLQGLQEHAVVLQVPTACVCCSSVQLIAEKCPEVKAEIVGGEWAPGVQGLRCKGKEAGTCAIRKRLSTRVYMYVLRQHLAAPPLLLQTMQPAWVSCQLHTALQQAEELQCKQLMCRTQSPLLLGASRQTIVQYSSCSCDFVQTQYMLEVRLFIRPCGWSTT